MRRWLFLLGLLTLAVVPFGHTSPTNGPEGGYQRIDAAADSGEPGRYYTQKNFRAGERACVMAIGDHEPVVNLTLNVYDASGKTLIAQDKGSGPSGDFVMVTWYPPRTADYRIEVLNPGSQYNKVYVAIK